MRPFTLLILFLSVPAFGWVDRTQLPSPRVETLPNKLKVVWFEDSRFPVLDLAVVIRAGFHQDPPGKSGVAKLLNSVLDKEKSLSEAIDQIGATRYLMAEENHMTIGLHGLSLDQEKLLASLEKMVLAPAFSEENFKSAQELMLAGWTQLKGYSQGIASLALYRMVFNHTSYSRSGMWSEKEFRTIRLKDLESFYQSYFKPDNAVLLVVGQFDSNKIRSAIQKSFGAWTGSAKFVKIKNYSRSVLNSKTVVIERKGESQAYVSMGMKGPSMRSPDYYALMAANAIIGGGPKSRLSHRIRDELRLTHGLVSFFKFNKDMSIFSISTATPYPNVNRLILEVKKVIQGFRKRPLDGQELEAAQAYLIGSFPSTVSSTSLVASRWLSGHVFGMGDNYLNEFIPRIRALTVEEVNAAIRKHIRGDRLKTVVVGDLKEIRKTLKGAKRVRWSDLR